MSTTTVTRPDGQGGTTADVYTMYGYAVAPPGSLWRLGLTKSISLAGGAETEDRVWQASPSVAAVLFAAPGCTGAGRSDSSVTEPLLSSRVVTRDTGTHTTGYQNFDAFGQAQTVVETGPAGQGGTTSRTSTLTYFTKPQDDTGGTLNMVKGFPLTTVVCVGTDCVTDGWTYAGPSNAMDSRTLSGLKTTYGYHLADPEGRGNLRTVTNALGQTLTLSGYAPGLDNQNGGGVPLTVDLNGAITYSRTTTWEGWLLSQTDGRHNKTSYQVDGIGRVTRIDPPGTNDATTILHDQAASGGRSSISTRGTFVSTETFDGFGRKIGSANSLGVNTSTRYDELGRQWFKSYPYASIEVGEKFDLDALGRVHVASKGCSPSSAPALACGGPDLSTVTYTYGANNCVTTDEQRSPDTLTTVRCYDAFGAPEQARLTYVQDAMRNPWTYGYTTAGELKTVTAPDARGNRSYTFDATQFMTGERLPELDVIAGTSLSLSYTPNALGQVKTATDARGVTTTYDYVDALSRLTSIAYSSDAQNSVSRGYQSGSNNLSSVSSPSGGAYSYPDWDELDRARSQTWTFGGSTYTTGYVYDSHYCLTQIQYPTGSVVDQTCDASGRVKTISIDKTPLVTDVTYDASSQVATIAYPAGRSTTYSFDTRARMKTATTAGFPGTTNVVGLSYTYDGLDNVTTLDNVGGYSLRMCSTVSGSCSGGYDALNRLVVALAPSRWGAAGYSYDALGNRTFKTSDQPTPSNITYTYDGSNRLSNISALLPARTFTWDAAGRLAASSDGASYKYDGHGRRVSKTVAGVSTVYHHDSAGTVIAETTSSGLRRNYVYLAGKLVAASGCLSQGVTTCNEVQWYHTDALGSVLAYTDANGNVLERFEYAPWGESWSVSDPSRAGDRHYNGRVYDAGTGFHDYGARLYWPEIGRFVSVDAAAPNPKNPASFNRYSYVYNNPYKYTDPDGEVPFLVVTGGIGALAGGAWGMYTSLRDQGHIDWGTVGKGALVGGAIGLGAGAGAAYALAGSATASVGQVGAVGAALLGVGGAAAPKAQEAMTTLYHGGKLIDGAVRASRSLSTTTSLEHAMQYAEQHAGEVTSFQVPTRWLMEMERTGAARRFQDLLKGTTESALEWRFYGEAAAKLNEYLAPAAARGAP